MRIVASRWAMTRRVGTTASDPPRPVPGATLRFRRIPASIVGSTADVESSSTSTRGRRSSALAMARRWRWPPDRVDPRSPTTVSSPSGSASTNPSAATTTRAASISSSVTSLPRVRLSRTVSAKRKVSWRTGATMPDAPSEPSSETSTPPRSTRPAVGWTRPQSRETIVLFPDPVAPTMATDSPGWIRNERSASTGAEMGCFAPPNLAAPLSTGW